jgi:valyl-tRNA synthetase
LATSSCTPLIIGRWMDAPSWFAQHFPMSLRPQAHDIIRTWAFYTIVKAEYHLHTIPWHEIAISGHALSAARNKISKSKGDSSIDPMSLIEQESADALRYWATSMKPGNDTPFTPESLANARRLVTKLWNASRFAERHLQGLDSSILEKQPNVLLPTDRWLLSRFTHTIATTTAELEKGDYAAARTGVERFFWSDFCDNYLELAKARLYQEESPERLAAQWTLYHALLTILKLLAPYLPFITEEIYLSLFQKFEKSVSIHTSCWPEIRNEWEDKYAEQYGEMILECLHQVRRYKADRGLSLSAALDDLHIAIEEKHLSELKEASIDLIGATRAKSLVFLTQGEQELSEPCSVRIMIAS